MQTNIDPQKAFACLRQISTLSASPVMGVKTSEIAKKVFHTKTSAAPYLLQSVSLLTQKLKGESFVDSFHLEIEGAMLAIQFLASQPGFQRESLDQLTQLTSVLEGKTSSLVQALPPQHREQALAFYGKMQQILEHYPIPTALFISVTKYLLASPNPKELLKTLNDLAVEIQNCKAINRSILEKDNGNFCTDRMGHNKILTDKYSAVLSAFINNQMDKIFGPKLTPEQWKDTRLLLECCFHAAFLNNIQIISEFVESALYPVVPAQELSSLTQQRVIQPRESPTPEQQNERNNETVAASQRLHVDPSKLAHFDGLQNEILVFRTEWKNRQETDSQPFVEGVLHIQYMGYEGKTEDAEARLDLSQAALNKEQCIQAFDFITDCIDNCMDFPDFIGACMQPTRLGDKPRPLELKDIDFEHIPKALQSFMDRRLTLLSDEQKKEVLKCALDFTYNIVRKTQLARNLAA